MTATTPIGIAKLEASTSLPVFVCDLSPLRGELDLARQAIEELRASHPESTVSNVQARYMSPWKSHQLNPKLLPLCLVVQNLATEAARLYLGANLSALNLELMVTDCWGIVYEQADHTVPHHHFPADFGCAIYLEADEDSAPLIFGNGLACQPTPGMMLLFPGILVHQVPSNGSRRVVVSMNLHKRTTFATADTAS